ncbi:MAG: formylglycine-generating enzyme family protein [Deltaproteobacteria bacterium]|nr:formylglycine-generating enzyme family protein [Deltaproteobacteria bacterium]
MSAWWGLGALWLVVLAGCGPTPVPVTGIAAATFGDLCPTGRFHVLGEPGVCAPEGTWVTVPAGRYLIGAADGEVGGEPDQLRRAVTLTHDFAILSTEVTQAQFEARAGYNPSGLASCGESCPVENVSWHEAAEYCNLLSASAGLPACYSCTGLRGAVTCVPGASYQTPYDCPGYRLPTEAEWEVAARAGTATATYSGDLDRAHRFCEQPNAALDEIAWFCGNAGGTSHPVAMRAANGWGLYDMLGNVWEWCADWYEAPGEDSRDGGVTDPWGAASGTGRVLRGGCWEGHAGLARAASGLRLVPAFRANNLGFRPVRTTCRAASCGECRSDADCASGQGCLEGRCLEIPGYCDRVDACQAGLVCRANRCSVCLDDRECEDGSHCEDGLCRPLPVCLDFCSTGGPCINGLCFPNPDAEGTGAMPLGTDGPVVRPPADHATRAQACCESGRAALEHGDAEVAIRGLEDGIALLEPLGLGLTAETGGDVLAACLFDLGRVREVARSDEPSAQPEVLYGRSLALRPDDAVAERLRSWLEESGGEDCALGQVHRSESVSWNLSGWTAVAQTLAIELDPADAPVGFADEAEALAFLFGDEPSPPEGPVVATIGVGEGRWTSSLVFLLVPWLRGTVLVSHSLVGPVGGRCPDEGGGWLVTGDPVHAVGFVSDEEQIFEDREGRPCEEDDEDCLTGCVFVRHSVVHLFVDSESGRTVTIEAEVEDLDPVGDGEPDRYVQVERLAGRLVLYGCGTRMELEP